MLKKENSLSSPRILERLKGRKDNRANIVRRIITAAVVNEIPQQSLRERSKAMGVSIKTLRKSIKDLENMGTLNFVDAMKKTRKSFVLTQEVKDKIFTFYKTNSRNSTNTKEMILIDGQQTAVKYLEHTVNYFQKISNSTSRNQN